MVLREVGEVLEEHRGLSRKVLEYSVIMKRLVDEAKKPDFGVEGWARSGSEPGSTRAP